SHVINAELPKELDFYSHRSGRTARAGLSGSVFSLYTEEDAAFIQVLETQGIPLEIDDILKGELVQAKRLHKGSSRPTVETDMEREDMKHVKTPQKVKPRYKKRMKQEQARIKHQMKKKKK